MYFADFGPYTLEFTPSGRYMAAAGRKGHIAIVDMKNMSAIKELQVFIVVWFIREKDYMKQAYWCYCYTS